MEYLHMKALCAAVCIIGACILLTGADWPTFRGGFDRTGSGVSAAPRSPTVLWSVRIPEAGDIWSSPVVAGGFIYIGGISGSLYCLDAASGALVWEFSSGIRQPVFSTPTVVDGRIFFTAYRMLFALPAADPNGDGRISDTEVIWRYPLGPSTGDVNDVNCASPAVADGILCVGSVDQHFYGFDAGSGRLLWRTYTPFVGQHAFSSSPAIMGRRVFAATGNQSGSGRLYCFDISTGGILWEFDNDDITFSTPAAADGMVFICNSGDWIGGNQVHRVFCLDADGIEDGIDDGQKDAHRGGSDLIWSADMGSYAYSSPALNGGRLYVGCTDGSLRCLDAGTGRGIWVYKTPPVGFMPPMGIMGSAIVAGGAVMVGTADGRLIALSETDSTMLWSLSIGAEMIVSSPALADGSVFIAGARGRILRVGER
jgi:outer membrane protein assembly factor BamB